MVGGQHGPLSMLKNSVGHQLNKQTWYQPTRWKGKQMTSLQKTKGKPQCNNNRTLRDDANNHRSLRISVQKAYLKNHLCDELKELFLLMKVFLKNCKENKISAIDGRQKKIKPNHSYACRKKEGTNKRRGMDMRPYIRT